MTACPTEQELRRVRAGEASAADQAAIAEHLARCRTCRARDAAVLNEHEFWLAQLRSTAMRDQTRVAAPSPAKLPEIAGYDIRGELSRGGQGVVYLAAQRSTQREVVVKILRDGIYASTVARLRFEREIELAAELRHPNIVCVLETGATDDGHHYLVMDRIRGTRLDEYVRRPGLSLVEALRVFAEVCDAVNHAHQRGVIHRDLKPSNILVAEDGRPSVLDFGLARRLSDVDESGLTHTGQIAGTLAYLSPEQVSGPPGAVDTRSDVYALGVLLYEVIAGAPPYPLSDDPFAAIGAIAGQAPDRQRLAEGIRRWKGPVVDREALTTVVLTALAKEPDRRYQTVRDLVLDLRRLLERKPIAARRESPWALLQSIVRRHRLGATVVAAFLVVLVVSAAALSAMYARQLALHEEAEQQAYRAEEARRSALAAQRTAERRFQQVRNVARAFIFEVDAAIKRLPGAAEARRLVVNRGLEYLDALVRESDEDLDLQRELSAAYVSIGDVQGERDAASLGDYAGALSSYQKAHALLLQIVAADPSHIPTRRMIVLTRNKMGDALHTLDRSDEALEHYRAALERLDSILLEAPRDVAARGLLATTHERIGDLCRLQGSIDTAVEHYQEALRLGEQLAVESPDDVARLRGPAATATKLAGIHYARGRYDTAAEHYQRLLDAAAARRAIEPDNIVARTDEVIGHQWLGIISKQAGALDDAIASLTRSIDAARSLLAQDSHLPRVRGALAGSLTKLSEAQLAAGKLPEARHTIEALIEFTAEDCERSPSDGQALRRYAVAHYKFAEYCARLLDEPALADDVRIAHLRVRREHLAACRAVFVEMRDGGLLQAGDAAVPDELAAELDACNDAIIGLEQPAGATSDSAR